MSYGLTVKSSGGSVQIDSTYQNYYVIQRGYVTATAPTAINSTSLAFTSGGGVVSYPAQSEPPLILIRPPYGRFVFCYKTPSVSSFTVYVSSGESGASCEYIVLGRTYPSSVSGYGLCVRNASGTLVFSSNSPAATFTGVVHASVGASGALVTATVPSPLKSTFVLLNAATFAKWVKTGGIYNWGDIYATCVAINSQTSVSCKTIKVVSGWNASYPWRVWETPLTTYPILIGDQ